jgi:hypothetical protein
MKSLDEEKAKPVIIVLSDDDDGSFDWLSEGWYQIAQRGQPEAEALMRKADKAIAAGSDVKDVIRRLERPDSKSNRGFHVL